MFGQPLSFRVLIWAGTWAVAWPLLATAQVDLLFDPASQTVSLDEEDIVEIDLTAHSSDGSEQAITVVDAIITWDPELLELLGAIATPAWFVSGFLSDPDNINEGIGDPPEGVPSNDGDALYTALAPPGTPAIAGEEDLVVTTLVFRALQTTPATLVSFIPNLGSFGHTRVLGEGIQNDITGDISATATVSIVQGCSEECPTDVNGDLATGPFDLATLLGCWGPIGPGSCQCLDANNDGDIGPFDLATLLAAWGPCD